MGIRTRLVVVAAAATAALAPAACVSLKRTPEARFFVLRPLVEPPEAPVRPPSAGLVGVLPVRLPGPLERPQLVTWAGLDEIRIDEYLRWAEPIDAGVARTLAENLDALLPAHPVIRSPWPAAVTPLCRVRVELRVFGPQEGGEVRLEGRWMLLAGKDERPLVHRTTSLRRFPAGLPGADVGAGVEAMSALLADLSREIAAAIDSLPTEAAEK